jgi:hypothetical protein
MKRRVRLTCLFMLCAAIGYLTPVPSSADFLPVCCGTFNCGCCDDGKGTCCLMSDDSALMCGIYQSMGCHVVGETYCFGEKYINNSKCKSGFCGGNDALERCDDHNTCKKMLQACDPPNCNPPGP